MKEDFIQSQIIKYHQRKAKGALLWCCIRLKNEYSTAKDISLGVVPGAADLMLTKGDGNFIWVEVKTPKGTQSERQINFEKNHVGIGNDYFIVRSVEDFIKVHDWYFFGIGEKPERDSKM